MHMPANLMLAGVLQGTFVTPPTTIPPAYSVPSGPKAATASAQLVNGTDAGCQLTPSFIEERPPHAYICGGALVPGGYANVVQSAKRLLALRGLSAISGS